MALGSLALVGQGGRWQTLTPESVSITGQQDGFIVGLTVCQRFRLPSPGPPEISYIVPNRGKICMYDTTFRVGDRFIKPMLEERKRAEQIFVDTEDEGQAALLSWNLAEGLIEFRFGCIDGGETCEVEVKLGVWGSAVGFSSVVFTVPLSISDPSGCICDLGPIDGDLSFLLSYIGPAKLSNIEANHRGRFARGRYEVTEKPSGRPLVITTTFEGGLGCDCLLSERTLAVTCYVELPIRSETHEFVFIVDCSDSMAAKIREARECLGFFVRQLPSNSFFNVIRFGSRFELLFGNSSPHNQTNIQLALTLAEQLAADLGKSQLHEVLRYVFRLPLSGVSCRQLFIIVAGWSDAVDRLVQISSENRDGNRVFTVGLAGSTPIDRLANVTGGRPDHAHADVAPVVTRQLQAALSSPLTALKVHIENDGSAEVVPYPVAPVTSLVSSTLFVKTSIEVGSILLSGLCGGEQRDIAISSRRTGLDAALLDSMWAHEALESMSRRSSSSMRELHARKVRLGIESGVLCPETAFVGVVPRVYRTLRRQAAPEIGPQGSARTGGGGVCASAWVRDFSGMTEVRTLGEGAYGTVTLVEEPSTREMIALKSFQGGATVEEDLSFFREIEALIHLTHPCIVPIVGYSMKTATAPARIGMRAAANGSLRDALALPDAPLLDATGGAIVIAGVALGMRFTHARGWIHRDLKPSNILLDEHGYPQIGDLGTSRLFNPDLTFKRRVRSPLYMAPEMYDDVEYTQAVDIYSFALVLFEILVRRPVFSPSLTAPVLMRKVVSGERPLIPESVHPELRSIIERGWGIDPGSRRTFDDIFASLTRIGFKTTPLVDSAQVQKYVSWVLENEQSTSDTTPPPPPEIVRTPPTHAVIVDLSLSVRTVMSPLDQCARIAPAASVRATAGAMTEFPQGAALVFDDAGVLVGILTEGDLRRAILAASNFDEMTAEQIMSKELIVIGPGEPLRRVIGLMENKPSQISVLPVVETVDGKRHPVGLLRLHDMYSRNTP
jgi:serine/threonine protein kinase